eukprot:2012605-Alexandrium_andersonii.AAC.1
MAQGQPDGWPVGPVRQHCFDLPLVQGAESQGMELPCDSEGHNRMPAPGEPGCAAILVAIVGPESKGPQSLHGRREWAAH